MCKIIRSLKTTEKVIKLSIEKKKKTLNLTGSEEMA